MKEKDIFDYYADEIWSNDPNIAKDRIRWHTSGHHIEFGQLTIEDSIEDAYECLDIIPKEVGLPLSIKEWQKNYMDNPEMISAMAKTIYNNLKKYGRYAFKQNIDWNLVVKKYIEEF